MEEKRYFEGCKIAENYLKSRPQPPTTLIERVIEFLKEQYEGDLTLAVDVGCGSGQNTILIAKHFERVLGCDISSAQIDAATEQNDVSNVQFTVKPAEELPVENESVQLITSSTAAHWFDLPRFFAEGERVLCQNGVMALYCNKIFTLDYQKDVNKNEELNRLLLQLCHEHLGSFWPPEIHVWENEYKDIVIPFRDFTRESPILQDQSVSLGIVVDRIRSWPGFQGYAREHGQDEADALLKIFTDKVLTVMELDPEIISPHDAPLTMGNEYFLLMARK